MVGNSATRIACEFQRTERRRHNEHETPTGRKKHGASSLRGLWCRSATGLNGQAAKHEVSAVWWGLDVGKYFWRSGREECFSLDIPFIGLPVSRQHTQNRRISLT
jgi:hypothetical protein